MKRRFTEEQIIGFLKEADVGGAYRSHLLIALSALRISRTSRLKARAFFVSLP